ncbi:MULTISPECIES: sugar porter family MFS transporter [unclassified Sphingobium]|uniref:sugar porter family MFS transporter n=1 Tax=unclassified Sphingobium TaxID=2611147 RepID=UPI002223F9F3|nr:MULTISPECIES: sugar porter family MFS transporter [unclassified Sphingobium]MCW2394074.1 sugar porter (SP) family MFS transporter [Sphingobium sp. B8D3B]MCW2417588.1 sugar porter (SP) family MFS transporter [Sphingobium sp. B8D3C]
MPNRSISLWAFTAALAGLLFGFDTAVISGAEMAIQRTWSMGSAMHGLAISSALWGTVVGALFGAIPSDRYGRKPTLIWIGILYLVSAIGSALAWDPWSFMAFRIIGGLAIGASSIAAPAYISEIAPPAWRGRLGILFQTMIVLGILIAYVSNALISGAHPADWRIMLAIPAIPAALFLLATVVLPESPRWLLLHKGNEAEARRVLAMAGGDIEAIRATADPAGESRMTLRRFFNGHLRRPIMLAFLVAFFNQLSGINAIIYYAPRIFGLTGAEASATLYATVGVGVVNLVFTLVGMALIDSAGRRKLMLIGSVGYIVSLAMVAYGFASAHYTLVPVFIFLFIAAHAIGQGAIIWVYISEIFPNNARATGQALGTGTHWVLAAALTLIMPAVLASVAPVWIFGFFAFMMVLQLLFTLFMMVETRGRSLEELSADLASEPARP